MKAKLDSCAARWHSEKDGRIRDIRKLWRLYTNGEDESDPDLGRFDEYGLSFDYVAPFTFKGQRAGYWRWQISYGGPSEEFRFYGSPSGALDSVEYWLLDWLDGKGRKLRGADFALLAEIWESYFDEYGAVRAEFDKANAED